MTTLLASRDAAQAVRAPQTPPQPVAQPIKIAILAMGGEGGGVLADWIVALGEANGYVAQTTSVPGVAQRTGATIYYVELYPQARAAADRGTPVLALMPLPGDVDIVLASELMEAGRAVQRGYVTPERTTLIASTHRVYAIAEKIALGDGRVDSAELLTQTRAVARRFVRFDMAEAAQQAGSVISAVLFGALAGTGVLPFSRAQFEATIERGGVGVKASLRAFGDAYERAQQPDDAMAQPAAERPAAPPIASLAPRDPEVRALLDRIAAGFAEPAHAMLVEGVRRTLDYQDPAYAALYLDRMAALIAAPGGATPLLVDETARYLALWMSYEDTIRVAALKTRATRFERVRSEVGLKSDQVVTISEYMHPRLQEIVETLPGPFGRWLQRSGWARALVSRHTQKGRVVRTSSLPGFLLLYVLAGLRRWRRSTLRYQAENAAIERWLATITRIAATNPELAIEVARCQRLVKGYSDTYERGVHHFGLLMAAVERGGAHLAPATLSELRNAALADEEGAPLRALLARLQLG